MLWICCFYPKNLLESKGSPEPFNFMILEPIHCPDCEGLQVIKHGKTPEGKQRYRCQNADCKRGTFIREYSYTGLLPKVKQQICDMAMNGSGIRDTARVLGVSQTTVINTLKKKSSAQSGK